MSVDQRRALGQAKNAVLEYLRKRLAVPKVFFDRQWGEQAIDVLAIDRDGVGDVHAVQMFTRSWFPDGGHDIVHEASEIVRVLNGLQSVQAQYKYVAIVNARADKFLRPYDLSKEMKEKTFSPDGFGRVGFLTVNLSEEGEAETQLMAKPERFRAFIAERADEFLRTTPADWEIRPDPIHEEFHA